jgi:hypothetical protein
MKVAMSPSRVLCGVLIACAGSSAPVWSAQPDPAADPKFAPAAERARQEGDKVYKWILINGAAPRRPDASASAPAASAISAPRRLVRAKPEGTPNAVKPPGLSAAVAQKTPPASAASAVSTGADEDATTAAIPHGDDIANPMPPMPNASATSTASSPQEGEDVPLVLVNQVEPEFPVAIVRRQCWCASRCRPTVA